MTEVWLCDLLDRAGSVLLKLEDDGLFVSEFRVGTAVHRYLCELRRQELAQGLPLIVLGTEVVEDTTLEPTDFALTP